MELRNSNIELRTSNDGKLVVSGYANKTNQLSEVLTSGVKKFREKIMPGAFKKAIQNATRSIDFLAEHNSDKILSSTNNGSLQLREDNTGLFIEAEIAPTSWGTDYYTLIETGIIRSMSFGFRVLKDSWTKIDGMNIRTVEELELFEVSAVKNPAYLTSELQARSIDLVEVEIPNNILEERGENNMTLMKMEKRNSYSLAEILRGEVEARALQTTADGGAVIPEEVSDVIVLKMEETSPVFARARKLISVNGALKVARETGATADGGFVGEGVDLAELVLGLEEVKLEQKRVGAAINVSKQLLNDSAANLESYVKNLLARRIGKAIEKSILTGSTVDEFKGIINDTGIGNVETATVTIDKLLDLYLSIHPEFLSNAMFIMKRDVFNTVARLKDNNGHFYIQNGIINGKLTYTLFGCEVSVSDSLTSTVPVVFGNITEAYSVMIKKDMSVTTVSADTTTALKGTQLFVGEMFADGAVVNTQAVAKLTITA